jgi:hypothetical protein
MTTTPQDPRIRELEARKAALKAELNRLETDVAVSVRDARDDLAGRVSPVWWIRRYPLQAVGVALAFGFMAASGGGNRRGGSLAAALMSELKSVAARKAVQHLVESIDKKG